MQICMLIYNYWPENTGGAENQCRKLVKNLVSSGDSCIIVTGRHSIATSTREEDNGSVIFRLATFETILQKLRIQKKNSQAQSKATHTDHPCQDHDLELLTQNMFSQYLSRLASFTVCYLNALLFGLNVSFFLYKRRRSIAIIHVHIAGWHAGLAAIAGLLLKIPVICKGTNLPVLPDLKGLPFSSWFDRWRRRPFFIALTESMRQDLLLNSVPSERIHVISNGVVIPEKITVTGLNSSFLFVGNFSQTAAHKGFDILLLAWREVIREEPDAHMVLVGGGDASPWQLFALQLGIEKTVTFAGYQTNLEEYYLRASCFVLPSRKEGISNALLEAQSYGVPAIVSDIPGNREVVVDGMTGCIVPVGDTKLLAQAMLNMYRSPLLREKYGKAARERVKENFSMNQVAMKVRKLYEDLLA